MEGMKTFILALFLVSLPSFAQDYTLDKETGKAVPSFIGQLRLVQGKVFKRAQGRLTEVYSGERFFEGNSLVTGKDSMAKMMMVDESIVSLGPEGEILFKKFIFKDKENRTCEYELVKGQLRGNVPQKLKTGNISFRTKFSTMGIRGTQILVNHQKIQNHEVSEFALLEGKADLQFSDSELTTLSPHQHVVVVGNQEGNIARDLGQLSDEKYSELEASPMNEEKEFKPFLPLITFDELSQREALSPVLAKAIGPQKEKEVSKETKSAPKNWRDSLKKLNEQLKKNQD